ncbi:hypothetical protein Taro_006657 [Colocasia esculenta]|uniref:Cytochrome b5 heme-binding domain-containing protein n=1 Tax=Colocasia esculenta TaxID=4460 RepID=A0A843TTB9_COLES|nr:hypothetical protein [Colocasia esculenta]
MQTNVHLIRDPTARAAVEDDRSLLTRATPERRTRSPCPPHGRSLRLYSPKLPPLLFSFPSAALPILPALHLHDGAAPSKGLGGYGGGRMRSPWKLITSPASLAALTVGIALAAVLLSYTYRKPVPPRLWTVDEVGLYNGTDKAKPILLAILGSVFDVTKGKSHYGPGGGYHHFAGRDASRAFISGNFTGDGLTDSLHGLSSVEMKSVVDWRAFYLRSYRFVGVLVGRYYDSSGNPTKHLKGVEAKAARGAQLLEKQKIEEDKIPSCNSRWSERDGGEVWCDVGYPRLMQRPLEIALTGKMSKRCVCLKEEELGRPDLEVYQGCDVLSKSCTNICGCRFLFGPEPNGPPRKRKGRTPARTVTCKTRKGSGGPS